MLRMSHPDAVTATVDGGGHKTSVQGRENYQRALQMAHANHQHAHCARKGFKFLFNNIKFFVFFKNEFFISFSHSSCKGGSRR